jgi:outer membrane protein assembly factor BamB
MRALLVLSLASLGGCGEAAFSAHARDNVVEDIRQALALSQPPAKASGAMAYLVTTAPNKELIGYDLAAGKILWREKTEIRSRVVAARGLIAHRQGENEIVARDPASGRVLFSVRIGAKEKFVGQALDDERLYYVVQGETGGGPSTSNSNEGSAPVRRVSYVVGVDRTGKELWRVPVQGSAGAPAARGGLVAVPYSYQNLDLLDGKTGKEMARVRNSDEQITFVRALPEGIFYGGGQGVYLLDEKSASGTKKESSYVEANLGSDQVRSSYWYDGYQPAQADYTAFDRNRFLWRATPSAGGVSLQDDAVILHSYRYLFAFDAKQGKLRWAYNHPRVDIVAAEDVGSDIVWASVDGDIGALDEKTGGVHTTQKTGLRLSGATFDAEGFGRGKAAEKPDLLKVLSQIVWDPDARFTAVKVFAVDAMGDVAGAEASAALLKIVLAPQKKVGGIPPAAQKRAGDELVARKDKEALPLYIDALKLRYDFLEDRTPQGVDVLARAVATLDAREAAPQLAVHLLDAATPQPLLKDISAALAGLGGKDALKALREFLLTYRADPTFLAEPSALNIAGEGLLRQGGADEKRTVRFVAEDKRTLPPLGSYLKKVLADSGSKK